VLRAYEFYILLGKYKRDALTPGEFEKFAHAIRTVRKYRHAFHESTGDRKPYPDRSYKTGKPREKTQSEGNESELFRNKHSAGSLSRRHERRRSQSTNRSHTQISHPQSGKPNRLKNVPRSRPHSRRRHRWLHLSASILKEYRKALAIGALGLFALKFAIWWFASKRTEGNHTAGIFAPGTESTTLSKPGGWSALTSSSFADGSVPSEADQLLSIASNLSDSSSWRAPAPVQTSIEQAIWNEMNTYFSRPEEVFSSIKTPEVPME
jgi:hypothetical protein